MTDRRRLVLICACITLLAAGLIAARTAWSFPIGYSLIGFWISNVGFAVQLAALVAGIALVHAVAPRYAVLVLAAEGTACTLGYGLVGLAYLAVIAAWYAALTAPLGRIRWFVLVGLIGGVQATAWTGAHMAGLVFSMTFTLRLVLFAWDRWQHDFAPAPVVDYVAYMTLPPLVVVPPFLTIIPFFEGLRTRLRTGMSRERVRAVMHHAALAVGFGIALAIVTVPPAVVDPTHELLRFAGVILHAATLGHLMMALLSLHGIDERLPLVRPMFATRYVELWSRYMIHLKDAQVALFYAPALLALRRYNRYLALIAGVAWTILVGNFILHALITYAFRCARRPAWDVLQPILLANLIIAVALAIDLCWDEWHRRRGVAPRTRWRSAIGWAYTMTIAASVSTL